MNMTLAERIFEIQRQLEEQERMDQLMAAARGESELPEEEEMALVPTPTVGHDLHSELLMKIYDMLQVLNTTMIGVNLPKGKRPPKIRPLPRPRSALDVLRAQAEIDDVDDALADMGIVHEK